MGNWVRHQSAKTLTQISGFWTPWPRETLPPRMPILIGLPACASRSRRWYRDAVPSYARERARMLGLQWRRASAEQARNIYLGETHPYFSQYTSSGPHTLQNGGLRTKIDDPAE